MQRVEIRVRGQIDKSWSDYFGRLNITHNSRGETVMAGPVIDQAELRGVIVRLADLGLDLISVSALPNIETLTVNSTNGGGAIEH